MQETHHIVQLLKKSLEGSLSPVEEAKLRTWAGSDAVYQALLDRMRNGHSLEELLHLRHSLEQHDRQDYADQLQEALDARIAASQGVTKSHTFRRWLRYAAAALIVASAATWIFFGSELNKQPKLVNLELEDIQPGGSRATLTLPGGQTIDLSEAQTGIVIVDGDIAYNDGASLAAVPDDDLQENTLLELSTPQGGTYQVTLPDGTNVWLNSASTLKYPSRFDKDNRVVELIGEAYFDVTQIRKPAASSNVPFWVVSAGQTVKVLGTEFNITAYADETETKTTLVEGAVQILNHTFNTVSRLQPGEQAINRAGNMTIKKVDTEQFTAWKDGFFYFDGLAPNVAFDQLERWYDIEVTYQGSVPSIRFFGMIDRGKPLSSVLKTLEKSGLKFQMMRSGEKNRLIIVEE